MLFSEYAARLFSNQDPFTRNSKKDVDIMYQTWFVDNRCFARMLQAGKLGPNERSAIRRSALVPAHGSKIEAPVVRVLSNVRENY